MRTTPDRKTPGVYVTELDAFPPSIVGVQTAVPAFIGYTQYAEISGKPVFNRPIKVNSMVDFEKIFGKGYKPQYDISEVTAAADISAGNYDFQVLSYGTSPDGVQPPPAQGLKYYKLTQVDTTKYNLYDSIRLFYANGGGTCYVVSVAAYDKGVKKADLEKGLLAIRDEVGPTMLVIPDAVLLPATSGQSKTYVSQDFQDITRAMLDQCKALQDRVALLDVYGTTEIGVGGVTREEVINQFRLDVGDVGLSYGGAYFPFVHATVYSVEEVDYTNIASTSQATLKQVLSWQNQTINGWKTTRYDAVEADIAQISETPNTKLSNNLTAALPLLTDIDNVIVFKHRVQPTSAAMAGVYTANDATKGVWNAPANVSLNRVNGLTYKLDDKSQGDLNVPVDGKSVMAIRDFVGRGQVVWGARTLDGNSPDYRYMQVRRTLIYIEQSVKTSLNQFVFAANDGKTWVTVVSMVSGFLRRLWEQGGLMGNTPSDAFTVECGLGSTMTGQDILDGYMIVQITLQMIRPAEFIELTFKQKMEGAA